MAQRKDPFRNFRFLVEWDGIQQAAFSEVTGIESTVEPIDYRCGDDPTHARKLPGMTKYSAVTLKWGVTDSLELHDWHEQIVQGVITRKNLAIVLMNEDGKPGARWEVQLAWPSKYHGADMNAKGNDVGIETLELSNEGIVRKKP